MCHLPSAGIESVWSSFDANVDMPAWSVRMLLRAVG